MAVSNYLPQSEVTEVLKEYIEDERNRQAVLLNGVWGCGKTRFIDKEFFPELRKIKADDKKKEKYHAVRVSLYGVSSREELDKKVAGAFLSLGQSLAMQVFKVAGKVGAGTLGGILEGVQDTVEDAANKGAESLKDIWEKHKGQIKLLVLDDFERSAMNPVELMGIINDYAENEGYKLILLADEGRLSFSDNKQSDMALQYGVILNHADKIKFPAAQQNQNAPKSDTKLDKKQLEQRAEWLFPPKELYKRTKEKLIGLEITFRPDFNTVANTIISESVKNCAEDKNKRRVRLFVKANQQKIIQMFDAYDNRNFRTLNNALVAADKLLLPVLKRLQREPAADRQLYREEARKCLQYIVCAQILKSLNQLPELPPYGVGVDYRPVDCKSLPGIVENPGGSVTRYKFVDNYMETHFHDDERIWKTIQDAVHKKKESMRQTKDSEDYQNLSLFQLNETKWTSLTDAQLLDCTSKMLEELRAGKYLTREFREIIITLMDINHGGEPWTPTPLNDSGMSYTWNALVKSPTAEASVKAKYPSEPVPYDWWKPIPVDKYVTAMEAYFKVPEKPVLYKKMLDISADSIYFIDEYREHIKSLIPIAERCERDAQELTPAYSIDGVNLRGMDWNDKFPAFCREHRDKFYESGCFLSLWEADKLAERLKRAEAAEIANFHRGLSAVYSIDNYDTVLVADGIFVEALLDAIKPQESGTQPPETPFTQTIQLNRLRRRLEKLNEKFSAMRFDADRGAFV